MRFVGRCIVGVCSHALRFVYFWGLCAQLPLVVCRTILSTWFVCAPPNRLLPFALYSVPVTLTNICTFGLSSCRKAQLPTSCDVGGSAQCNVYMCRGFCMERRTAGYNIHLLVHKKFWRRGGRLAVGIAVKHRPKDQSAGRVCNCSRLPPRDRPIVQTLVCA